MKGGRVAIRETAKITSTGVPVPPAPAEPPPPIRPRAGVTVIGHAITAVCGMASVSV